MNEILDALRGFPSRLVMAIHGIGEENLHRPESTGKWAIADVIAHLGDLELLSAVRFRAILAETDPRLPGFRQDAWADTHRRTRTADLLERFGFERRANVALLERCGDAELARSGEHPDYGPQTLGELAARVARHQEKHFAQIERIKRTLGLAATETPHLDGVTAATAGEPRVFGPGVRIRELWRDGVKRALQVEFDAGAQWPGLDYHVPGPEEVYIVSGDFDDGRDVYRAGTFLHHPAGSSHQPHSAEGCTLFVFYPEG